jgi:hypothetical protein
VACEKAAAARRCQISSDPKANDPECVHVLWMWLVLWQEERLLLIVLLAGVLGALLHCIRSFATYVGMRKLVQSWLLWYALTPIVGALLALVFYLTARGGLFSSSASASQTSPFGFAAVGALVGMFSRQAAEKLLLTFEALFSKAPANTDPSHANPTPVLLAVDGPVTHGLDSPVTLTGTGFTKVSKAHIADQELATVWLNDKQLKVTIPAKAASATGQQLTLTVVTPPPGGGTSQKQTVTVV